MVENSSVKYLNFVFKNGFVLNGIVNSIKILNKNSKIV